MQNSIILEFIKEYIILGLLICGILAISFCMIQFVLKKMFPNLNCKIKKRQLFLYMFFICYIIVVIGATFGNRGNYVGGCNLYLFSSYRQAWNNFSFTEWRDICLNIVLFVPMGCMIPLIFPKIKKYWKVILLGLCTTFLVECIQFVTSKGIFEIDDIFNNLLGVIIGYGLFGIVFQLKKGWQCIGYALPLLATLLAFVAMYFYYNCQEFGNLSENYSYKINMDNIDVINTTSDKTFDSKCMVYSSYKETESDLYQFATEFYERIGLEMDEDSVIKYDNTIQFGAKDGKGLLSVNYIGLTYNFIDYRVEEETVTESVDEETVIKLLKDDFGIVVPSGYIFTKLESGECQIAANYLKDGETLINGTIRCSYSSTGALNYVENKMIECKKVKECEILSKEDIFNRIKQGKFFCRIKEIHTIEINDLELSYRLDTKGFFQPVYEVSACVNKEEVVLIMPALKE